MLLYYYYCYQEAPLEVRRISFLLGLWYMRWKDYWWPNHWWMIHLYWHTQYHFLSEIQKWHRIWIFSYFTNQCLFNRRFLVKANIYINGVTLLTLYTLEKFLHKNCKVQISNIENSVNPFEGKAILLKRGFKYQTSTQKQPTQQMHWRAPI